MLLAAALFFSLGMVDGFPAAISAAITGALFWWLLIERPAKLTYRQGAIFGFLAQWAAFPVMYFVSGFLGLPAGIDEDNPAFIYSGPLTSVAEIADILHGMLIWVGFHSLGIIITGPIGIVAGLLLIAFRRRV